MYLCLLIHSGFSTYMRSFVTADVLRTSRRPWLHCCLIQHVRIVNFIHSNFFAILPSLYIIRISKKIVVVIISSRGDPFFQFVWFQQPYFWSNFPSLIGLSLLKYYNWLISIWPDFEVLEKIPKSISGNQINCAIRIVGINSFENCEVRNFWSGGVCQDQ